jgi:hypothetical protein
MCIRDSVITYENPGVANADSTTFDFKGVETFDTRPLGAGQNFVTDFGTTGQETEITGTYSNVTIRVADQFGGADGTRYADANDTIGYTLSLSTTSPDGINYFGYWLSALDGRNTLQFLKEDVVVYTFTPAQVLAAVGANPAYFCNPFPPAGRNCGEPYVFVNLFFTDGDTFDKIRFFQSTNGAGYESDNHTVGFFLEGGGNPIPEPATWAMLIAGFGMVGLAARRRRNPITA